jgi:hypothetical protein
LNPPFSLYFIIHKVSSQFLVLCLALSLSPSYHSAIVVVAAVLLVLIDDDNIVLFIHIDEPAAASKENKIKEEMGIYIYIYFL